MNSIRICVIAACSAAASVAMAGTHVGIGISFGVPAPIIVHRAPPARVMETAIVAPGPGYVWVPGHYTWGGNRWIWITGAWMLPPRPDARWVDGSWNPQSHQWIEAHWEVPATPPPPPPPPVAVMTSPAPVVVASPEIVVVDAPPAPIVEVQSACPGPDFVWIGGYWGWEHGRREWYRGHWERPPVGHHTWVAPRWEHRDRGYVYIRGRWN